MRLLPRPRVLCCWMRLIGASSLRRTSWQHSRHVKRALGSAQQVCMESTCTRMRVIAECKWVACKKQGVPCSADQSRVGIIHTIMLVSASQAHARGIAVRCVRLRWDLNARASGHIMGRTMHGERGPLGFLSPHQASPGLGCRAGGRGRHGGGRARHAGGAGSGHRRRASAHQ